MPGTAAGQQGGDRVQVAVGGVEVAEAHPEPAAGEQQLDRVGAGRPVPHGGLQDGVGLGPLADPEQAVGGDGEQAGLVRAADPERGEPLGTAAGDQHPLLDVVQRAGQQLEFTWALVRDELDQRLRSSPALARTRSAVESFSAARSMASRARVFASA